MAESSAQFPEFLFGELSTTDGRLRRTQTETAGLRHACCLDPADPRPGEPIQIKVTVGKDLGVKAIALFYTTDGSLPTIPQNLAIQSVPFQRQEVWDSLMWYYREEWMAEIPGQPLGTEVTYAIAATTFNEERIYCPAVNLDALENNSSIDLEKLKKLNPENKPQIYSFIVDQDSIPSWLREAVIYQIFVDRFAPTSGTEFAQPSDRSGFYGGTLAGIISKLDYLQDLGINCLWLTPIFPSPSHHGYDPMSFEGIEPRLGSLEDWQRLISEAHGRGIRILLDFVANHFSDRHPAFVAATRDRDSEFFPWFYFRDWPEQYDCFFAVSHQPEVNGDYPAARQYLLDSARHWLALGCDGFRLDYAQGMSHAFWSAFRRSTRQIKADSVTLAEITDQPSFLRAYIGRMDGCLDFVQLELLRGFFAFDTLSVSQFHRALDDHLSYWESDLVLPSFLDNHDMNRFLWIVEGDTRRLKLAALCQFTLPQPPIIYYGTEVGVSQVETVGPLEESRLPMHWGEDQDLDLLAFYRELIHFRQKNRDLWHQERRCICADDTRGFYGYGVGQAIAFLNNSTQSQTVTLTTGEDYQPRIQTSDAIAIEAQGSKLHLPAYAGVVLLPREERR